MEQSTGKEVDERVQELVRKYHIDIEKLKKEQEKLAKQIEIKDDKDFSEVTKIGGFANIFVKNKIISACVVMSPDFEIIEQKYFSDKVRFPYIPGFRAYRELPAMISCYNNLDEKPEVVFIPGHGITHERLGMASHFSIATGVPTIGIAENIVFGNVSGDDVLDGKKVIGKVVQIKQGARPLYVSPGNLISVKSSVELTKKFVRSPHKLPEPLHLAHKYAREVLKEVSAS